MNLKKIAQHSLLIPILGLSMSVHAAEKAPEKAPEEVQNAEQIEAMKQQIAEQHAAEQAALKKQLAEQLTKYKKFGLVGERANGYVAPVRPRSDVNQLVQKINQGRLVHYKKIALEAGYSVIQIELIAGKKSRENAKSGHYIEAERLWIKKQ